MAAIAAAAGLVAVAAVTAVALSGADRPSFATAKRSADWSPRNWLRDLGAAGGPVLSRLDMVKLDGGFSIDGTGNNWTNHTSIFSGYGTGYTSFEEVSPGRLLFIFDVIGMDHPSGDLWNGIRGVYIDVDFVDE